MIVPQQLDTTKHSLSFITMNRIVPNRNMAIKLNKKLSWENKLSNIRKSFDSYKVYRAYQLEVNCSTATARQQAVHLPVKIVRYDWTEEEVEYCFAPSTREKHPISRANKHKQKQTYALHTVQ